jgi:hypothetical protein
MKIRELRLFGIRCFEDTGDIALDQKCNIFVGKNNAGKSTILKSILGLQGFPFDDVDIRPGHHSTSSYLTFCFDGIVASDYFSNGLNQFQGSLRILSHYRGNDDPYSGSEVQRMILNPHQQFFPVSRPHHTIVPFLAKRKAVQFSEDISLNSQSTLSGTLSSLYSRIDLLATYGHPSHDRFREAVTEIVGLSITMKASTGGKKAGFYFDENTFVTLDRMGDGV